MGETLAVKILSKVSGQKYIKPGDIIWVKVDIAMIDDILGPRIEIADGIKELGDKIWNTDKVVIVSDHYTPPCSERQAEIVQFTRQTHENITEPTIQKRIFKKMPGGM